MPKNVEDVEFLKELLLSMRNEPIQHDVVFIVNGERFPTHKNVVAAASPVLRAMFTSGMKESTQSEVTLQKLDTDVWRRIDTYIYRGTIQFDGIDDALDILECSTRFQIERLRQLTLTYLGELLNEENCIRLLHTADKYNASELYESAMNRVVKSLHSVAGGVEFAKLQPHLLEALHVKSSTIMITEQFFNAYYNLRKRNRSDVPSIEGFIMQVTFSFRILEHSHAAAHDINYPVLLNILRGVQLKFFGAILVKGGFRYLNN